MPVTPTYPGLYIEEVPSNSFTVTPAPTSVTVFIGYSHPFKTVDADKKPAFGKPLRVQSYAEYERYFGGIFRSDNLPNYLPYAVYQFFLNGGSEAIVVGLEPLPGYPQPTVPLTGVATITALEPTDFVRADGSAAMNVQTANVNNAAADGPTADIIITYGTTVETFRAVKTTKNPGALITDIESRINSGSRLIQVSAVTEGASYPVNAAAPAAPKDYPLPSLPALNQTYLMSQFDDIFSDEGLLALEPFNLMCLPGIADNAILAAGLSFCEKKLAFFIMDPPENAVADANDANKKVEHFLKDGLLPTSQNGALYFPYLKTSDLITGDAITMPPSGYVAGTFARSDVNRGVWTAPAGLEALVRGTTGVADEGRMTDKRQGTLNSAGVNCLRQFSGVGTVIYGARTLTSSNVAFQQYKYVPVRRMALFLEQSLMNNLGWAIFRPNAEPLWTALRLTVEGFMLGLFKQGAFKGLTPNEAFQVVCDKTTTSEDDIRNGIVHLVVAFRPLLPAEFVIIRIAQLAGQTQA